MFTCKIENVKHEILELTGHESDYQIISISGLNPSNAQINRNTVVGIDGSKFNSAKLEERNIVITLRLNGDVESNRLNLYRFFNSKQWCKFYYKNNSRDVYIEGHVETVECDLFSNSEIMQVSILCLNPYFKSLEEMVNDISKVIAKFQFPFSISAAKPVPLSELNTSKITNVKNKSEIETGFIVEIEVNNHCKKIEIRNVGTGESLLLNGDYIENDKIIINTHKGGKSISLHRSGRKINIFSNMQNGSTFFQLSIGDNYFSYLVDGGTNDNAVGIVFKNATIYGGV